MMALEASPIATPLLQILEDEGEWEGTATDLLDLLNSKARDFEKRNRAWPSNSRTLSNKLRRIVPNLEEIGWKITFARDNSSLRQRIIKISDFSK